MNILIDLTPIYDHLTGVERFAINISKNIIREHPECDYTLLFKQEVHKDYLEIVKLKNVKYKIIRKCNKFVFSQIMMAKCLYKLKCDAYVFMASAPPWIFLSKKIIYTQHDLSAWDCPETRKRKNVIYAKISIRITLLKNPTLVTVSEFSKKRIIQVLHYNKDKIFVIYNGVTDVFCNGENVEYKYIKEKYSLPEKYILCLSTLEPRKNLKLLLKAFYELKNEGKLSFDLVLAGRKGWKLDKVLLDISPWNKNVYVTGFIDDSDLPTLYKNAELFAFPSLYEGFGIPIIEAQSQSALVLSSDAASLPEIIGNGGILFKSSNIFDLKVKIQDCLQMDEEDKEKYRNLGKENIKRFNWGKEANKFFNIISMLINKKSRGIL